jgi:hypothetical protein
MSERADDKTIQFGALANPDARRGDSAADPRAAAQTVQFGAATAQPKTPVAAISPTPPKPASSTQFAPAPTPGGRGRFGFGSVGFIVCAAAVIVAVIGAVIAVLLLGGAGNTPLSGEQQVEAAIRNYYAVVRDKGLPAASAISCKQIRDTSSMVPDGAGSIDFKQDITIEKIDNVKINGDTATAQVTGHAQAIVGGQTEADETDSTTLTLQREDGQWKYCTMQE